MSWPIFLLIYFLLRHEVRLDKCFGNKLYLAIILELIVGSCPERYYILHINTEKTLIWKKINRIVYFMETSCSIGTSLQHR